MWPGIGSESRTLTAATWQPVSGEQEPTPSRAGTGQHTGRRVGQHTRCTRSGRSTVIASALLKAPRVGKSRTGPTDRSRVGDLRRDAMTNGRGRSGGWGRCPRDMVGQAENRHRDRGRQCESASLLVVSTAGATVGATAGAFDKIVRRPRRGGLCGRSFLASRHWWHLSCFW
jgi:hypothetical protein